MVSSQTKLVTVCKNCAFAQYTNKSQTGCYARSMNEDEFFYSYEDDLEYRIFKRQCQFYRDKSWNNEASIEDKLRQINYETLIKYHVIIDGCSGDVEELRKTINSINGQTLAPQKLIVAYHDGNGKEGFDLLQSQTNCCPWVVEEFLEDRQDWRDDILLKFKDGAQLFAFLNCGMEIDPSYFMDLSDCINHQDLRFEIWQEGDNLLIIPYGAYFMFYKDLPLRFMLEKIYENSCTKH